MGKKSYEVCEDFDSWKYLSDSERFAALITVLVILVILSAWIIMDISGQDKIVRVLWIVTLISIVFGVVSYFIRRD